MGEHVFDLFMITSSSTLSLSHFPSCQWAATVLTDVVAFCYSSSIPLRQTWRNQSAQIHPILLDNRGVGTAQCSLSFMHMNVCSQLDCEQTHFG